MYAISPTKFDEKFVKTLVDILYEELYEEDANYIWVRLASEMVEKWDPLGKFYGPAYVYVKIAVAWGVEFRDEYVTWNERNYTGVIKLCVENACIYEDVGYGSEGGYIYKSFYYAFELD